MDYPSQTDNPSPVWKQPLILANLRHLNLLSFLRILKSLLCGNEEFYSFRFTKNTDGVEEYYVLVTCSALPKG